MKEWGVYVFDELISEHDTFEQAWNAREDLANDTGLPYEIQKQEETI